MTIRTIVAALALEVGDDPVVGRALQLALQHEARLIVVHVLEGLASDDESFPRSTDRGAVIEILEREAKDRLGRLLEAAPVPTEIIVEAGAPHSIINRLARRNKADLVVIGPGKARNIREKVFGSTADRVVRSSRGPILIVKTRSTNPYRRVASTVDFSTTSIAAAQAAALVAPGVTMELVHAVEIPLAFEQAMLKAGTPQVEIERYRRAKAQSARKQLLALFSKEGDLPRPAKVRVLHGTAGEVLVRLARRGGIDLITVGTQGRNAVSRLVLGSVARKVLAGAACDILVVPPGAESSRNPQTEGMARDPA